MKNVKNNHQAFLRVSCAQHFGSKACYQKLRMNGCQE